jgi:DNA mismatch repair protein MutL
MSIIKQLSPQEAQKIAAGQVVERPASVIKELIENALDAQATNIAIHVIDGGKKQIRVVDNGCGMDTEDAQLCFAKHATSKISCLEELQQLITFGFRGEALASIAAVSRVTLHAKLSNSLQGTQVTVVDGIINHRPSACPAGTDITIDDIFYNTPARQKFLKTTQTEWRAIVQLFNAFCFSYPTIHFRLFSDDTLFLNCPPVSSVSLRCAQLLSAATTQTILTVHGSRDDAQLQLQGVITNHQHGNYDRSQIFLFVNNRWVKNYKLISAVLKGYQGVLPSGKFPFAALLITIDPARVDINIHPRKEEVVFINPRIVEQLIEASVKTALEANVGKNVTPARVDPSLQTISTTWSYLFNEQPKSFHSPQPTQDFPPFPEHNKKLAPPDTFVFDSHTQKKILEINPDNLRTDAQNNSPHTQSDIHSPNATVLCQLHNTYILIENEDGLLLVDQHAAHERILYEQFSNRFDDVNTIPLLFAQVIPIATDDMEFLMMHINLLTDHGIVAEPFGTDQLIVQAIPVYLKEVPLNDLIYQFIAWTKETGQALPNFKDQLVHKLRAQMACKAAIKAGDVLTVQAAEQLISDLAKTANKLTCPHGRPTEWLISLNEIERKFKRRT